MFAARTERSVNIARHMAGTLQIDLFDDHRRGRFREIVLNCDTCAHHSECMRLVMDGTPIKSAPTHCRNRAFFSPNGPSDA